MNAKSLKLLREVGEDAHVRLALEARRGRERELQTLLAQRRLPARGWDDASVRLLMAELAALDTNNQPGPPAGGGEREGRVYSAVVRERHFGMAHGVGRSGDVAAAQPKAAGSTLAARLASALARHALRLSGAARTREALVLPVATGMAIALTLVSLRERRPGASVVLVPRIDHKACLKAAALAGMTVVLVENVREGDELRTDVPALRGEMARRGDAVLCVLTTASCFAPRAPDRLLEVARACDEAGVPHVVNNAYGVQARDTMSLIGRAAHSGRVDAYVCSTDKNFMCPVGGSVVASFEAGMVARVAQAYPGRASGAPAVDLLVTLLSMGEDGYTALLDRRERVLADLRRRLQEAAAAWGERVLHTPNNPISLAVTLDTFARPTYLGSMAFSRGVTGPRAVARGGGGAKEMAGARFDGWGAHAADYPHAYMTVAAAVGMTEEEAGTVVDRLGSAVADYRRQEEHGV